MGCGSSNVQVHPYDNDNNRKPSTTHDNNRRPSSTHDNNQKPSTTYDNNRRPSSTHDNNQKPSTTYDNNRRPSSTHDNNQKPSTTYDNNRRPSSTHDNNQKPSTTYDNNRRPSSTHENNEKPSTTNDENNEKPTTYDPKTSDANQLSDEDRESWLKLVETVNNNTTLKNYVLSKGRTKFNTMDELKEFLVKAPVNNDVEKAWVVFLWITHNIDYDFDGLINGRIGDQSANTVFKTGKSVCAGYSKLSNDLFDCFNIKSVIISGYAKGYGYQIGQKFTKSDHAWNAVFIDNKWQFVESTWGAGHVNGNAYVRNFKPHYFFTPAEVFIYDHFPEKIEYQFLSKPIALSEYEEMPSYELEFFMNSFKCLSHSKSVITPESNQFKMEFSAPEGTKLSGHLKNGKKAEISNSVLIQRDYKSKNIIVEVALQSNENVELCLFGGKSETESYSGICNYIVKPKSSITKAPLYCETYSTPVDFYLIEPKENSLKLGQEYTFRVHGSVLDFALIDSKKNWTHLGKDKESDIWTINYKTETIGQLQLSAKVTDKNSYSTGFIFSVI